MVILALGSTQIIAWTTVLSEMKHSPRPLIFVTCSSAMHETYILVVSFWPFQWEFLPVESYRVA